MKYLILPLLTIVSCQTYDRAPVEPTVEIAPIEIKPAIKYGLVLLVVNNDEVIASDIFETKDSITEDYKYRELDLAEKNLRDAEYDGNDSVRFNYRDMLIFDNYKDASIARQKILNGKITEHEDLNTGVITYKID